MKGAWIKHMSLVSMLIMVSISISMFTVSDEATIPSTRAEIPTWYKGDRWTYEGEVCGSGENWTMDAELKDIVCKVLGIESVTVNGTTYLCYKMNITGTIEGNFTWNMVPGKITGTIESTSYYRIADLSQVKTEMHSYGEIKLVITHDYDFVLTTTFCPSAEYFDFPLKIGDNWKTSSKTHVEGHIVISELYEKNISTTKWVNKTLFCPKRESISTPAGVFNVFLVTDNEENDSYYSPEVGNTVAGSIYYSNENDTVSGYIVLKSYHRATQSIAVTLNLFPCEFIPGEAVKIYGEVRYTDTGEPIEGADVAISIPILGENFTVSTNETGYYEKIFNPQAFHDNTPSPIEIGSDGVIAKCALDSEEGYRVKTLVCIDHNTPPEKPRYIIGVRKGYTNESYVFSSYAYDLNYDPMYYKFSWGDGTETDWMGAAEAETLFGTQKAWNRSGTFEVKVKAKDFRGAESPWSDPFEVEIKSQLFVDIDGPYHTLPGESVTFNATVYGGYQPYTYHWDFGDGATSNESNPSHVYDEEGIYTVTLTVHDNHTAVKTDETTVIVGPPDTTPPTVVLEKPWRGIYISNNRIIPFFITIVIGSIDIEINVTDESGIEYVALYIDGNEVSNFTAPPYTWTWSEKTFGKHEIKVVAADIFGNTATAEFTVWKLL